MTVRDTAVRVECLYQAELAKLLLAVPPGRRGAVLQQAASFTPGSDPDQMLAVGSIRAAFADFWEARFRERVPVAGLRCLLEPPVPIATALEFNKLILMRQVTEIEAALGSLADFLRSRLQPSAS